MERSMDIHDILTGMDIPHRCIGNTKFSTLGLIESVVNEPYCTFVADERYACHVNPSVVLALVPETLTDVVRCAGLCVVDNPRSVFFRLHNHLAECLDYVRRDFRTEFGKNCRISPLACIAEKNVKIGSNAIIEEFVSIKENVVIGNDCTVRAGSILGGEGFEFKRNAENNLFGVRHLGGVIVKDHAEIQYNACIDKAVYPWDDTVVGEYAKIDNLVHIAHGVKIGKNTMVVANAGIGGRVVIGDDSWIGFGATIRNGIIVGNRARANMGAVVTKNVGDDEAVTGNFAIPHAVFLRNLKDTLDKFAEGENDSEHT